MDKGLYWQVSGQGDDIILVHGWGMNGAVWDKVVSLLAVHFRVHVVDLPGYGNSHESYALDLDDIAQQLMKQAPKNAIWVGWSLGGLIATYIARQYPQYVRKLVTVASSPKFSANKNPNIWSGIPSAVLSNFTVQLTKDFKTTIDRFMGLQTMGSPSAREDVKQLKKTILSRPLPDPESLLVGLKILSDIDLREHLKQISVPILRLYGRLDGLVPLKVSDALDEMLPRSEKYVFSNSSHAPFMTETALFCEKIQAFAEH